MADQRVDDEVESGSPDSTGEARIPVGGSETKAAFIRLFLVVGAGVVAAVFTGTGKFLLVVAAVIAAIMIHELGHFVAARLSGMKVTEYFLGFGPKLWSFRKGEVEYGIKAIPAGGYVKIIGMSNLEEVDPADESRAYRAKSFSRRVFVAFAGPATHFVIAVILMFIMLTTTGLPETTTQIRSISGLQNGPSPAQLAGFQAGDRIVGVDGRQVDGWDDLKSYVSTRPDRPIAFDIERGSERLTLSATPTKAKLPDGTVSKDAVIGFSPTSVTESRSLAAAVPASFAKTGEGVVDVLKGIKMVFSPSGLKTFAETVAGTSTASEAEQEANRIMSPVGMVKAGGDAIAVGLTPLLLLLFVINLFLGVFNLLPLPPFDGGHIAVATYEKIRSFGGRKHTVDYAKLLPLTYTVLLFFVTLSGAALFLDITDPAPNYFE